MSTPIYDQMRAEQFQDQVNRMVAEFETHDIAERQFVFDDCCSQVDATADRHGNPLLTAVGSAIVGGTFLAMVALALWGWLA